MSDPVQNLVLTVVAKSHYTPSDKKKLAHKEPKTLEEIIEELGWVVTDMDSESAGSQSTDCLLEATIPPRFMSKTERVADSQSASGGYLKHLRNPDQPTSVSRQIEGIPRTESRIYALANNVRMMQKINGKPKAKLLCAITFADATFATKRSDRNQSYIFYRRLEYRTQCKESHDTKQTKRQY